MHIITVSSNTWKNRLVILSFLVIKCQGSSVSDIDRGHLHWLQVTSYNNIITLCCIITKVCSSNATLTSASSVLENSNLVLNASTIGIKLHLPLWKQHYEGQHGCRPSTQ